MTRNVENTQGDGYTPRSNCINEWTENHGMILQSHIIKRNKYENSSLLLLPWFDKTDWVNEKFVRTSNNTKVNDGGYTIFNKTTGTEESIQKLPRFKV